MNKNTLIFNYIIANLMGKRDIAWQYGFYTKNNHVKGNYQINRAILPFNNILLIGLVAMRQIGCQ